MNKNLKLKKNIQIGPYRILKCIGTGGMGEVYKAHEETLNRHVALKFITAALQENTTVLKRLEIEGKTLAQISHPNIVTIYGRGIHEGHHYLAMEYVSGIPLELVYEKKLPLKLIVKIFSQLLSALKILHENKIIHRDIKPNNIIIKNDYNVKLIDFGIANMSDPESRFEVTNNGEIVGSIKYLSPEVIDGNPITELSDIRSLGLVIYQLITGKYPYNISDKFVLAEEIRTKVLNFKTSGRDIPQQLQDIVLKMLSIDPKKRHSTIAQVISDLNDFQQGRTTVKTESRPFTIPEKKSSSFKPVATGLALGAIIFAGYLYNNLSSFTSLLPKANNYNSESGPANPKAIAEQAPAKVIIDKPSSLSDKSQLAKPEEKFFDKPVETVKTPTRKAPTLQAKKPRKAVAKIIRKPKRNKKRIVLTRPVASISDQTITINFAARRSPASQSSVALKWSRDRKAKKYELIISKDYKFRSNVLKKTISSNRFTWSPKAAGEYYWIVRASSKGIKSPYSKPNKVNVLIPMPNISYLKFNKITGNEKNFNLPVRWPAVTGASRYLIEISKTPGFKRVHVKKSTSSTSTLFPLNPGTYYLRSVSLNRSGKPISRYNKPTPVTIKREIASVPAPSLMTPKNAQSFKSNGLDYLEFSWQEQKNAMGYEIQLSTAKNFSNILIEKKVSLTSFLLKNPAFSGKIHWRVRTLKKGPPSPWSPTNNFFIKK